MTGNITEFARRKEDRIKGGDVNYYLEIIPGKNDSADTTVEAEDVIEYCQMSFANGCVFKALWRLCKLRQDLGKPGSTGLYEAEKDFYYSNRTEAFVDRNLPKNIFFKILSYLKSMVFGHRFYDPNEIILTIKNPKRLAPYSFKIGDLIDALRPTSHEANALKEIITLSLMQKRFTIPYPEEKQHAKRLVACAKVIKDREEVEKRRSTTGVQV